MTTKTKNPKSATISVALINLTYDVLSEHGGDEDSFTCQIAEQEKESTKKTFHLEVVRTLRVEQLFHASFIYSVEIEWFGGKPTDSDYEGPIGQAKSIVAAKASHLFASLSSDSLMLPAITPPFFQDELEDRD